MSEKDLNIEYICEKTLLNKDDELVPIILSLIQESYKAGLCQAEFDNTMNLIEENQELKEKLDKYEKPEDMTLFAMWCTEKVKDENLELKKQLENCYCNRTDCAGRIKDSKKYNSLVQKVETQQKEFIKYLEDEKDELARGRCDVCKDKFDEADDILQKYKEIIGENNV
jgi:hypothetical protein